MDRDQPIYAFNTEADLVGQPRASYGEQLLEQLVQEVKSLRSEVESLKAAINDRLP